MKSCAISNMSTVRSAISKASQPLHTGFSPALGDDSGCNCGGGNGSTARGVRVGGSLSSGCEPNCGFSGDDRKILFVTASLRNVPEIFDGVIVLPPWQGAEWLSAPWNISALPDEPRRHPASSARTARKSQNTWLGARPSLA